MLTPGAKVDRYELVTLLREGGLAQVWAARQDGEHGSTKLFAVKAVHQQEPALRRMFLDEARIAAEIEHPNVARVFEVGEHGPFLYLVMEYVDGESLAALLAEMARRTGRPSKVPAPHACRIVADVCGGLNAAHELRDESGALRGIVHGDVSPRSVLISVSGDVKLIDFGVALALHRAAPATGGSPVELRCMAPEQARSASVGAFTDVWAAGALLYRLLSGQSPLEARTEVEASELLLSGAAPPPLPEDVPGVIAAIVARALSPRPADRYPSAAEMRTALEAAIAEEGFEPDVRTWVGKNLTRGYHARREALAAPGLSAPGAAGTVPELVFAPRSRPPPPASRDERDHDGPLELEAQRPPANALEEPTPRAFEDVRAPVAEGGSGGDSQANVPVAMAAAPEGPQRARAGTRKRLIAGGIAATAVVASLVATFLALPFLLKRRIVAIARDAGIELTIDDVGVGLTGITIRGARARAASLSGVEVSVAEIFVKGLSAADVRVTGADVKLEGRAEELAETAIRFYEAHRPAIAPSGTPSRRVTVSHAHVQWTGPFGARSRIDAGEVSARVDARAAGAEDVAVAVGRFDVTTSKATLGPWSASFEHGRTRDGATSRARLVFDPPVPDGPSAVYVWGPSTKPHLTVKIPRTPLRQLGIKPQELGIPAEGSSELEVTLEAGAAPNGRVEAAARVGLHGAKIAGFKQATDVNIEISAAGAPGKPLEIQRSTVNVGPFVAFLNGTLTPTDRGLSLDAAWKTQPILCERLARAEVKNLGAFAATLEELATTTGAIRVTGSAYATGRVKLDTASPESATLTFQTRETCGLSLFGQ